MYQAVRYGQWGIKVWMPFYAETKKAVKEKLDEYGEYSKEVKIEKVDFPMIAQ